MSDNNRPPCHLPSSLPQAAEKAVRKEAKRAKKDAKKAKKEAKRAEKEAIKYPERAKARAEEEQKRKARRRLLLRLRPVNPRNQWRRLVPFDYALPDAPSCWRLMRTPRAAGSAIPSCFAKPRRRKRRNRGRLRSAAPSSSSSSGAQQLRRSRSTLLLASLSVHRGCSHAGRRRWSPCLLVLTPEVPAAVCNRTGAGPATTGGGRPRSRRAQRGAGGALGAL